MDRLWRRGAPRAADCSCDVRAFPCRFGDAGRRLEFQRTISIAARARSAAVTFADFSLRCSCFEQRVHSGLYRWPDLAGHRLRLARLAAMPAFNFLPLAAMALGRAQDLVRPVPGRKNEATLLGDLISVLLAPYDEKGASVRIRVSVPKVNVGQASGTTLALVIHELATNSAKYGALSSARGTLDVSCTAREDEVVVMWTERGGPPVTAPSVPEGFGSKLVHRTVAAQLGGAIAFDWSPEGVVVTLRMSKGRLAY